MDADQCWLIYHKASMGEGSSLNMDGSTYAYGVAVVPVRDLKSALELFEQTLKEDSMELIEVYKCVLGNDSATPYEPDLSEGIQNSVRTAISRGEVFLSVIGNESLDD